MNSLNLSSNFGFLVGEVGRLYGRCFDQLSRSQLGLSRAQCRLLAVIASQPDHEPWTQTELAQQLDLTQMGVATLLNRMEAAGWITRRENAADRRANSIDLQQKALGALAVAMDVGDIAQHQVLAGLDAVERKTLIALLLRVHKNLHTLASTPAEDATPCEPPQRDCV